MSTYRVATYDNLTDHRARQLYDWIVRYHQRYNGRRASHAEMRAGNGLSREALLRALAILEAVDLLEVHLDDRGKARSYALPGERWSHPHLATLEARKVFYPGTLLDGLS